MWDAASNKLYVSSHVWSESPGTGSPARLYRYSYNAATDTYSLDSGFPVQIHNDKAEATVIDKDSTGQLWATWVRGGQVWVNRSVCNPTCDDAIWGTPFQHPDTVSNPVISDDISALVTFANNRVGADVERPERRHDVLRRSTATPPATRPGRRSRPPTAVPGPTTPTTTST